MKLQDLQSDVVSVTKQLQEKYNKDVTASVKLNQDNLGEVIVSFNINTGPRTVETQEQIAPTEAPLTEKKKRKIVKKVTEEAANESQSKA